MRQGALGPAQAQKVRPSLQDPRSHSLNFLELIEAEAEAEAVIVIAFAAAEEISKASKCELMFFEACDHSQKSKTALAL